MTAVSEERLTLYVFALDLNVVFTTDDDTVLFGAGSGVETRPPEPQQPHLKAVARVGTVQEVHYEREGTRNRAVVIRRAGSSAREGGLSVAGRVRQSTGGKLTVEADGQEWTFYTTNPSRLIIPRGYAFDKDSEPRVLVLYRVEEARVVATEVLQLPSKRQPVIVPVPPKR